MLGSSQRKHELIEIPITVRYNLDKKRISSLIKNRKSIVNIKMRIIILMFAIIIHEAIRNK